MVSFTSRLLYSKERALDTNWLGGWVYLRTDLDAVAKRKTPIIEPAGYRAFWTLFVHYQTYFTWSSKFSKYIINFPFFLQISVTLIKLVSLESVSVYSADVRFVPAISEKSQRIHLENMYSNWCTSFHCCKEKMKSYPCS